MGTVRAESIIYLVRHGETRANLERRFEGRGDGDLTDKGLRQAELVANLLTKVGGVKAVYTSPWRRSLRTAEVISHRLGTVPVVMEGLGEVDFGAWEGLTFEDIRSRDPDLLNRWYADYVFARPPHGESLEEMWRRVRRGIEEVCRSHPSCSTVGSPEIVQSTPRVAVVTHGGPIRAILSYCERGDLSGFWSSSIEPGEVREVRWKAGRSCCETYASKPEPDARHHLSSRK